MRKILLDHEGNLPLICKNCSMKHGDSCTLDRVSPVSRKNCGGRYHSILDGKKVVVDFKRLPVEDNPNKFDDTHAFHCSEECADHFHSSSD
jgi:hypothetical protein